MLKTNNHDDGNRMIMTDDDGNGDVDDQQQDVHNNNNNNNDIHIETISYRQMFAIDNDYDEIDPSALINYKQNNEHQQLNDDKKGGILYRTNCRRQQHEHLNLFRPYDNNMSISNFHSSSSPIALSNKIIYIFRVNANDDQTQLACIANNPLITNHGKCQK